MYKEVSQQLMSFIQQSPTAFHAVDTMKKMLNEAGYQELSESQKWSMTKGGKYYRIYINGGGLKTSSPPWAPANSLGLAFCCESMVAFIKL